MTRSIFICVIFLFVFSTVIHAQDRLAGRIYEIKTRVFLGGIKIEDLKTHATALADSTGRFSIKTAVGDFISFSGISYQTDTLYVADLKFKEVFLTPRANMLDEVKVKGVQTKTGKLSAAPITGAFNSQTVLYQTDDLGREKGGVKIKVFDADGQKKKRHDTQIEKNEERQAIIFKTFQPKSLQNYLPITGVEMDNFIILYTPTVDTYFDPSFNLITYLNTSYKTFLDIPADQRKSATSFRLTLLSDTTKK